MPIGRVILVLLFKTLSINHCSALRSARDTRTVAKAVVVVVNRGSGESFMA